MISAFGKAFKTPDLRTKIFFTLAIMALFRLGSIIPTPGVSYKNVQACLKSVNNGGLFGLINMFSGGALLQLSIFALGIMPYITSSIIIQLLTVVIPRFEALKNEGQSGSTKLTQYTRYLTIGLALLQSTGLIAVARTPGRLFSGCSYPIIPDAYQDCEFLMLGNLMPSLQMKVLDRLKERPKLVVMDTMNFWMETAMEDLMKMIARTDVLTINDAEARQLSGEYSLVKAAQKILKMGPQYLIIKKGEHGALLFNNEQVFFAPALPLEDVFDPTGAGDTFAGGFIGHIAATDDSSFENMKRAIIYGSAMASYCVEKFGTERIVGLKQEEVEDRVKQFVDLVQFDIALV